MLARRARWGEPPGRAIDRRSAQPSGCPSAWLSALAALAALAGLSGFGGFGFSSSPVHVIGSKSWVGRKLTATSSPLLGERKTRQTLVFLPVGNFFGNDPGSHGVNALANVVDSTRVLVPSTM